MEAREVPGSNVEEIIELRRLRACVRTWVQSQVSWVGGERGRRMSRREEKVEWRGKREEKEKSKGEEEEGRGKEAKRSERRGEGGGGAKRNGERGKNGRKREDGDGPSAFCSFLRSESRAVPWVNLLLSFFRPHRTSWAPGTIPPKPLQLLSLPPGSHSHLACFLASFPFWIQCHLLNEAYLDHSI